MGTDGQIRGKQIVDGSIVEGKLATAYTQDVIKRTGAVAFTADQPMGGNKLTNLGAPTTGTDAARLQDIQNLNRKEKVRVATTANIALSGEQTIDGVALSSGDRCLVGNDQTTAADRGIYIVATGAWSRASDADSGTELTGAIVFVDEGTANSDKNYQQVNTIATPGSDDQDWVDVGGTAGTSPQNSNKDMTASVTTGDDDQACSTAIASTPNGYVNVFVNGIEVTVGDGAKTSACFFSGDGGTSARSIASIVANDTLHWVGSVAGYQLDATDRISLDYNAT